MHSNHEYLKLIFKNLNRSKKTPSKYDQKKKKTRKALKTKKKKKKIGKNPNKNS